MTPSASIAPARWRCGRREFDLAGPALVMGILNVTPDSFSDGGRYHDRDRAVERALEMRAQGADLIDIGGESTRPGSLPVDAAEECRRVVPVIEAIRAQSDLPISIDTSKAAVARDALAAGADIVNDVTALRGDANMIDTVAASGAGLILMHMQGTPQTMQDKPSYVDVLAEVRHFLAERAAFADSRGVGRERIAIDPGIGFGKSFEHNLDLLRGLPELAGLGYPLLLGPSRKSFLRRIVFGETFPEDWPRTREIADATAAAICACVLGGARIVRVHDVAAAAAQVRVLAAMAPDRAPDVSRDA
jgi:dihydropteroate synthase